MGDENLEARVGIDDVFAGGQRQNPDLQGDLKFIQNGFKRYLALQASYRR
jgi:hypothetical protein